MKHFDPRTARGAQETGFDWSRLLDTDAALPADSVADETLADLVALAGDALGMPVATLARRAGDRQELAAAAGLSLRDAPVAGSAFAVAIETDGPVALCRTATALLPGAPDLVAFAGIRIPSEDGAPLGVLSLFDTAPRAEILTAREQRILQRAARQIADWLARSRMAAERARLDEAQRIAQQAANIGIYISEPSGHAICSPEFYDQLGVPYDTPLIGAKWLELVHPEDRAHVRACLDKAVGVTDKFDCDFRIIREDNGEIRWISSRSRVERDAAGNPLRAIGANIDITDRKRAQEAAEEGRNLLRSVIDQSSDSIFVKDLEYRFVLASEMCERTIGVPVAQLEGRSTRDLFPPELAERLEALDQMVFDSGEPQLLDRVVDIAGEPRILQTSVMPWRRDERLCGLIAISRDITEAKTFELALRDSEERFRLAAQAAGLGIWDFDAVSGVHSWSEELICLMGLPPGTPVDAGVARALVHRADRPIFDALIQAVRGGDPDFRFEATMRLFRHDTGQERWISTNGWKTLNKAGELTRVIVTVLDVTKEKQAERNIRWTATHDVLTGLANRLSFNEAMAEAVACGDGGKLGLLLLDLDHFKQVNDTLGHDAGDSLLQSVGRRLRTELDGDSLVARLGGDEFAIVLRGVADEDAVAAVAARLLDRLGAAFSYRGRTLDCRASIGATLYPDHGASVEDLLKNADLALYAAKEAGRGKFALFRREMLAEQERRSTMLELAREALDADRVTPHYQAQVELCTGRLVGFEALLRWWKPELGIQAPGAIAAAFEDLDLASRLGERMIDRVIEDVRRWTDAGVPFGHVAINASAAEFQRDDFAERILARLAAAGVPTSAIEVEVTETVFLGRDGSRVQHALDTLHGAGVRIALDDFGTGYASLSHLKQFPVDTIKIDRSFIPGLTESSDDAAIVRALLNLGQSLGIGVVAEGVETGAQASYLRAHGCNFGQGFLFSHPLPGDAIPGMIDDWNAARRQRAKLRRGGSCAI